VEKGSLAYVAKIYQFFCLLTLDLYRDDGFASYFKVPNV